MALVTGNAACSLALRTSLRTLTAWAYRALYTVATPEPALNASNRSPAAINHQLPACPRSLSPPFTASSACPLQSRQRSPAACRRRQRFAINAAFRSSRCRPQRRANAPALSVTGPVIAPAAPCPAWRSAIRNA